MDNAQQAFSNYLLWLSRYPGDYKGATDAASDFIDTLEEFDQFAALIKQAAGK